MFAQSATVQTEIHTRIGKATAAYREMAKSIFGNRHIPVRTRLQLLESLVIPVLLHGCGTWPLLTERQFQKVNHVIITWQRKIANDGFWRSDCSSDWEFQARWKRIPLGLRLAKHRLLYAFKLVRFAPQLVLDYITAENDLCQESWLQAVTSAINWFIPREKPAPRDPIDEMSPSLLDSDSVTIVEWLVQHQSSGAGPTWSCSLPLQLLRSNILIGSGPTGSSLEISWTFLGGTQICSWLDLYCLRAVLLDRATDAATSPLQPTLWCQRMSCSTPAIFRTFDSTRSSRDSGGITTLLPRCITPGPHSRPDYLFWKRRVHQQLVDWRREWETLGLSLTPDQPLHDRVRMELTEATTAWIASLHAGHTCSIADSDLEEFWLPAMRSPDDHDEQVLWAFVEWGMTELYTIQSALDCEDAKRELEGVFLGVAECLPVYSLLNRKRQLMNWLHNEPVQVLEEVSDVVADTRQRRPREPIPDSLQQQSQLLAPQLSRHLRAVPNSRTGVPVVVEPDGTRYLYVLHMFSGRRREGDCHHWVHQFLGTYFPGFKVKIFSVDTAIHEKCGNLASGENFNLICGLARKGYFCLCLSGPPCETWSAARHLRLEGHRFAPRPLRMAAAPWGLAGRSMRELLQLTLGSQLMLNHLYLETVIVLCGGGSLMEHPAPPQCVDYTSIWRVPLHAMTSMMFSHAKQILIEQWRYGAAGVKPTTIRSLNLGSRVATVLNQQTVPGLERPKVLLMGLDESDKFRTSAAKEYPAGLCSALIHASLDGLRSRARSEGYRECFSSQLGEREVAWIRAMEDAGHHCFASAFLPDYQPNRG
eukprot:symbB.v1.2.005445.t2/scaffold318.1/size313828/8